MMQRRSIILWLLGGLGLSSCDAQRSSITVISRPKDADLRLSEVKFSKIQVQGTPQAIVDQFNHAMKRVGFKTGLKIEGDPRNEVTTLLMESASYREVMDQICLQLELSYWDDDSRGALHLQGGLTSSFDVYMRDEMGMFKPAGPRAKAPPGYDLLPLRIEYFNRKIQALESQLETAP